MIPMTSSPHDITPQRRRALRWLPAGAVVIALVIAGCGGVSYSSSSTKSTPSGSANQSAQAPQSKPAASAIPQNNGGDMDADNNGGPSDGDGNQ